MSSNETVYLIDAILNHVLGVATYTPPASYWLALLSAPPTQSSWTELPSTLNYSRAQIIFGPSSNKQISNSNQIVFPRPSAQWVNVQGFAIFDAFTGGNALYIMTVSPAFAPPLYAITMNPGTVIIGDIF